MTIRAPYAGLVIERNVRVGDMGGGGAVRGSASPKTARSSCPPMCPKTRCRDCTWVPPRGSSWRMEPKSTERCVWSVHGSMRTRSWARCASNCPSPSRSVPAALRGRSFTGVSVATVAVPETAILYDADGAAVMLVGADNTISREPIVTGQRGGGLRGTGQRAAGRFASGRQSGGDAGDRRQDRRRSRASATAVRFAMTDRQTSFAFQRGASGTRSRSRCCSSRSW